MSAAAIAALVTRRWPIRKARQLSSVCAAPAPGMDACFVAVDAFIHDGSGLPDSLTIGSRKVGPFGHAAEFPGSRVAWVRPRRNAVRARHLHPIIASGSAPNQPTARRDRKIAIYRSQWACMSPGAAIIAPPPTGSPIPACGGPRAARLQTPRQRGKCPPRARSSKPTASPRAGLPASIPPGWKPRAGPSD